MDQKELLEKGADLLEPQVKLLIEKHSDELVDLMVKKMEELIPGKFDDLALEAAKPELKKLAHDELLKLADKISPRV